MLKNKSWIYMFLFFIFSHASMARVSRLGAHLGGISTSSDSGIGGGIHYSVVSSDLLGMQFDVSGAGLSKGSVISTSPALQIYFLNVDDLTAGFLAGPGFFVLPHDKTRFALQGGFFGSAPINKDLSMGMETRFANIFGTSNDVWWVYLTLSYQFSKGSDW